MYDNIGNSHINSALTEAHKCLLCHDAPCSRDCPAGTDPGKFIRQIVFRNYKGAIRTIKKNNVLGLSCGCLCPSEELCQKNCIYNKQNEGHDSINIKLIQKEIMEYYYENRFTALPVPKPVHKKKFAVIGGGPAGLACAYELAKNGYSVDLYEKMAELGGALRYGVPNDRLTGTMLDDELKDLEALNIRVVKGYCFKGVAEEMDRFMKDYAAIFIAPGLWKAKRMFADHDLYDNTNIYNSIDYLKMAKDSAAFEESVAGKRVAIIGGGSVAIDCAVISKDHHAKEVAIIYRRNFTQMPAGKTDIYRALVKGVDIMWKTVPMAYDLGTDRKMAAIKLCRTELSDRKILEKREASWLLETDIVVEAIGSMPAIEIGDDIKNRFRERIFSGGDYVAAEGMVVKAILAGKKAAENMADA